MKIKTTFSLLSLLSLSLGFACTAPVSNALPVRNTQYTSSAASVKTATRVSQGDARLTRLENLIVNYVNEARRKAGLNALSINSTLAEVSRAHSVEMRDRSYFAHESPTPELRNPMDRYSAVFPQPPRLVAENIFRSWGSRREISDNDALRAHNALMNSPGHRANILRANITQIGVGVIANANGDLWVTQMFIRP